MNRILDKPVVTETHERRARLWIRWPELARMIRAAACDECGIRDSSAVQVEIKIEQETAGSPAYSISQWRATVTVIEDQLKLANPASGDRADG